MGKSVCQPWKSVFKTLGFTKAQILKIIPVEKIQLPQSLHCPSLSHLLFILYFSHSISFFLLSYSVYSFFFVFSLFFLSFLSLFSPTLIILSFCFSSLSLNLYSFRFLSLLLWIYNLPIYFFNFFCFKFTHLMQWISILGSQQIWVLQSNLKWEKFGFNSDSSDMIEF